MRNMTAGTNAALMADDQLGGGCGSGSVVALEDLFVGDEEGVDLEDDFDGDPVIRGILVFAARAV